MDIAGLIKSLNEHRVKFVIIGAVAFPVHGYARATFDIDIFISPDQENAAKTWQALKAVGYDMSDVTIDNLLTKKLLIRQYALDTDIHPFVKGVTFNGVWRRKVRTRFGRTAAYAASLADLIKMKRAAGRGKDREDLRYLLMLRKRA